MLTASSASGGRDHGIGERRGGRDLTASSGTRARAARRSPSSLGEHRLRSAAPRSPAESGLAPAVEGGVAPQHLARRCHGPSSPPLRARARARSRRAPGRGSGRSRASSSASLAGTSPAAADAPRSDPLVPGAPAPRVEPDLELGLAQEALERRSLELLLQTIRRPAVDAVQRKSARTVRPFFVFITCVKRLRRAPGEPSTSSTRLVSGHQRGRLCGIGDETPDRGRRSRRSRGCGRRRHPRLSRAGA